MKGGDLLERSTKDAWINGSGDLEEDDVEDVPVKGQSVRVRGLAARFSAEIQSQAKLSQNDREAILSVDQAAIEKLTFCHGVVDPKFDEREAGIVMEKYGPAFKKVVARINELSGTSDEEAARTEATFPDSRTGANGSGGGHTPEPVAVANPGPDRG